MSMAERKTMTRAVKNPVKRKLTRAEKKEIAAVIQAAKGDGKPHTAQQTIPYLQMYPDGICRVTEKKYSKSLVFEDINYQLAQADDKTAIFENWCDFLNYFDASVSVQLSFINQGARKEKAQAAIVDLAKRQVGNVGGYPYWSWYGFNSRVEWCACFVSWCYGQMGLSEPRFAACQSQGIPWFTSHGQWGARGYENIAPGDAIFFDWDLDGSADHVGLAIGRDEGRVYTVEGNSGDACKIKSYPLDYACIKGYGLMNWN